MDNSKNRNGIIFSYLSHLFLSDASIIGGIEIIIMYEALVRLWPQWLATLIG